MSDFVKAIPYFAEFAKREGPEALANFLSLLRLIRWRKQRSLLL